MGGREGPPRWGGRSKIQAHKIQREKGDWGVSREEREGGEGGDPLRIVDCGLRICHRGEGDGWRSICGSSFGAAADGDIRACILALPSKEGISLGTLGDREPGKS